MGRRYVDFGRTNAALYDVMFVKCTAALEVILSGIRLD